MSELVDRLHGSSSTCSGCVSMNSRLAIERIPYAMEESQVVRRSSLPRIRANMLQKGALFFKFEQPPTGSSKEDHVKFFRQMEELGFLVTNTGCMFPHVNFTSSSKGRPKGHRISALFFKGEPPQFPRSTHGWPSTTQVSHLCHRKHCVNPNHMVYEEQWRNLKRNYCGFNGQCDCGMTPKCLATYHNENWKHDDVFVTYDTAKYKAMLPSHLRELRYTVLSKDHYSNEDRRKEKRNERLRRKRKRGEESPTSVKKSKK